MIRKLVVAAGVGGLLVAAARGTELGRWVVYKIGSAWSKAEKDIPLEDQIAMMERDLQKVDEKTIPAKVRELAEARREQTRLTEQAAEMQKAQQAWHERLTAQLEEVKKATGQVALNGQPVPVDEARRQLAKELEQWEKGQDAMVKLVAARDAAGKTADAVRDEGRAMVAKRNELAARIQAMKTKLRQVRQQEMKTRKPGDDTDLAKLEGRVAGAEKALDSRAEEPKAAEEVFGTPTTTLPLAPSTAELEARLKARQSTPAPAAGAAPKPATQKKD